MTKRATSIREGPSSDLIQSSAVSTISFVRGSRRLSTDSLDTMHSLGTLQSQSQTQVLARNSFESLLFKSGPYKRAGPEELFDFGTTDTPQTMKNFRSVTLCCVSAMSVFGLPIFMSEVSNSHHYTEANYSESSDADEPAAQPTGNDLETRVGFSIRSSTPEILLSRPELREAKPLRAYLEDSEITLKRRVQLGPKLQRH